MLYSIIMPVPKPVVIELLARLNRHIGEKAMLSEFELASIRRDATKLLLSNAYDGHLVLGAVCAQEFDEVGARQHHKAAIALNRSAEAYANFAVSLNRLGYLRESVEQQKIAVDIEPEMVGYLDQLLSFQTFGGLVSAAQLTLKVWHQRSPAREWSDAEQLRNIASVAEKLSLDDALIVIHVETAFGILRERKINFLFHKCDPETEFGDWALYYTIVVGLDTEDVMDLNEVLYARLDEAIPNWNPARISVTFEGSLVAA